MFVRSYSVSHGKVNKWQKNQKRGQRDWCLFNTNFQQDLARLNSRPHDFTHKVGSLMTIRTVKKKLTLFRNFVRLEHLQKYIVV